MRAVAVIAPVLLAVPAGARPQGPAPQIVPESGVHVEAHLEDGGSTTLSIEARNASAEVLMQHVAHELRRELTGFDRIGSDPRIDAFLHRRPVKDAIRWVLGSVGLRADVDGRHIHVREDVPPYPSAVDLLQRANRRYMYALRQYPQWPHADRAEMARAEINEHLGPDFEGAALLSYENVVREHPDSDLVDEALLRSARLLVRLEEWSKAVLRFQELASLPQGHPYQTTARLELAEALCHVGEEAGEPARQTENGEKALHYLDALDTHHPTQDSRERRARLMVRSRAYSIAGRPIMALRALDNAARYSAAGTRDPQVLELRALAFSRAGYHGDASTAWLTYAEEFPGKEREQAYVKAASEALSGGHEIAVLAIAKAARTEGFGKTLEPYANDALSRLGLASTALTTLSPRHHLQRGEELLNHRTFDAARTALERAYGDRQELTPGEFLRLALAYARALDRTGLHDDAIHVLRRMVAEMSRPTDREQVYRLASKLYEERLRFDEAIEALQGKL